MATRRRPNYELTKHIKQLRELQSARSQAALNRKLARAFVAHVQDNFEKKRSPSGRKWAPRTRFYKHPLMELSVDMRGAWQMANVKVTAKGWTMTVPGYTGYHQEGTKNMPARRVYPSRQLPNRLREQYSAITAKHIENRLKNKK